MLQASTGTSSPRPHKSQSVCFFLIAFIANLTLFAYICNVMNKLSRLKYFMTFGIWNREEHENGWCKRTGLNVVRKMYMAIRLFRTLQIHRNMAPKHLRQPTAGCRVNHLVGRLLSAACTDRPIYRHRSAVHAL